jgi:uncharacterized membrane protein
MIPGRLASDSEAPAPRRPAARTTSRALDVAGLALAAAMLAVMATGGARVGIVALTRPEDFLVATVVVVGVRALLAPLALPAVSAGRALGTAVGVYVALMGFIVVSRHVALRTHAFDLGQYLQIIWNVASGHGPASTLIPTYVAADRMHAWGDHFSPIFYALAPLQWLAPGATVLLLTQTVTLAAGAVVVFQVAGPRVGRHTAAALGLVYLVNPSLHGINIRDIHPAAFAIPLLLAAALAFDRGRYAWCAAALVATLACREDAAVGVVGFATWLALARRRWLVGAALAVIATAVLAVDIGWLMPRFLGGTYDHLNRYRHLGGSLPQILASIALRPWRWIGIVLTPAKLVYLGALLAPLAFLPLLAPRVLAAALPGLAMNLLSLDPKLVHYQGQYQAFVLPFLVLATVEGYARLRAIVGERRLLGRHGAASAIGLAVVLSALLTARTVNDLGVGFWRLGPSQRAAYALMERIPDDAPVTAYERLVPHLATRRDVWMFPRGLREARYVLERASVAASVPAAEFEEVAREGPWVLWRRR